MSGIQNQEQIDTSSEILEIPVSCKKIINKLTEGKKFSDLDPEYLISAAKDLSKEINSEILKNHQLRRIFNVLKDIEYRSTDKVLKEETKAQLVFLKIHFANMQRREREKIRDTNEKERVMRSFSYIMDVVLSSKYFYSKKDLEYFVRFFEAILAYHS